MVLGPMRRGTVWKRIFERMSEYRGSVVMARRGWEIAPELRMVGGLARRLSSRMLRRSSQGRF